MKTHPVISPIKASRFFGKILLSLSGAVLLAGCQFRALGPSDFLTCDFKGSQVVVSHKGQHKEIDISGYVKATGDYAYTILSTARGTDFMYAVIQIYGSSPAGTNSACKGGREQNVVWLKLDEKMNLLDHQSVLIDSCTENLHSTNFVQKEKDNVMVVFNGTSMKQDGATVHSVPVQYSLRYDPLQPASGLVVTTNFPASNP